LANVCCKFLAAKPHLFASLYFPFEVTDEREANPWAKHMWPSYAGAKAKS
jgi:hypothetical protein